MKSTKTKAAFAMKATSKEVATGKKAMVMKVMKATTTPSMKAGAATMKSMKATQRQAMSAGNTSSKIKCCGCHKYFAKRDVNFHVAGIRRLPVVHCILCESGYESMLDIPRAH